MRGSSDGWEITYPIRSNMRISVGPFITLLVQMKILRVGIVCCRKQLPSGILNSWGVMCGALLRGLAAGALGLRAQTRPTSIHYIAAEFTPRAKPVRAVYDVERQYLATG